MLDWEKICKMFFLSISCYCRVYCHKFSPYEDDILTKTPSPSRIFWKDHRKTVLVNTGTFVVYQYCLKMWYSRSLECAGVIQKLTILEHKNGLVLSNTPVPVSGTWSILFPDHPFILKNIRTPPPKKKNKTKTKQNNNMRGAEGVDIPEKSELFVDGLVEFALLWKDWHFWPYGPRARKSSRPG